MTIPELICAILLIISAGILIINIVIKVLQKKRLTDIDKALLLIVPGVIFLFVIVLAYRYSDEIKLAEFLQILLMFGLVTVTIVYAWSASRQANASVKMAKAMAKPRLTPDFCFVSDFDPARYVQFQAWVHNDGNGPAYDVEFRIEDDSTPPNILLTTPRRSVVRGHDSKEWRVPDPRLQFPKSDKVQRRFFAIKYRDVDGEHEIRQPFVMETVENDRPFARLESVSKKTLQKRTFEEELP